MSTAAHVAAWGVMLLTLWWGASFAWAIWRDRPAVIKFEDGRVTSARSYVVENRNGR